MIKRYDDIILADIKADTPEQWNIEGATHIKVEMPTSSDFEIKMQDEGFYLADRTLGVSISLSRLSDDLEKYVRLPIMETNDYKEDILRIASASFVHDRRFHIVPMLSKDIASRVLKDWIENLDKTLVCLYKEQVIGFLNLKETANDTLFVHLAAVDEKYRLTGAAMALYAKACLLAKERGYKKLEGRISSQNTAVMNIYASLKATFLEPKDIYLKEVKNDA